MESSGTIGWMAQRRQLSGNRGGHVARWFQGCSRNVVTNSDMVLSSQNAPSRRAPALFSDTGLQRAQRIRSPAANFAITRGCRAQPAVDRRDSSLCHDGSGPCEVGHRTTE